MSPELFLCPLNSLTRSAHWLADQRFQSAIEQYTEDEKAMVMMQVKEAKQHSAYKR